LCESSHRNLLWQPTYPSGESVLRGTHRRTGNRGHRTARDDQRDKIKDCLEKHTELQAAWLFGSQVSGRTHSESDVDVAVLASQPLTLDQRLALEEALQTYRLDLVDLRKAGVVLQFEALNGERLHCRSPEKVAEFSSLVGREYESAMALSKIGYRARRERNPEQERPAS